MPGPLSWDGNALSTQVPGDDGSENGRRDGKREAGGQTDRQEGTMDFITMYFEVEKIDGDYAYLRRTDEGQTEPKLVARALLPDAINEGSLLKYEMLQYTMVEAGK